LSTISDVFIYGQEEEQENDLVFSVQGLKTSPITKDFQITGEVWEEICPSNQCQIEEDSYSTYIITPSPEDIDPRLSITLYFYLHDDITNKDLTPIQKRFVERFELSFSCSVNSVNDIIEQGNNTIYKCSSDYTTLEKYHRENTDPFFFYNVEGTYDTKSDIFTGTGQLRSKL
jgi:hypothetical protein